MRELVSSSSQTQLIVTAPHASPVFCNCSRYVPWANLSTTLGNAAEDGVEFNVVGVIGLDFGGETIQRALDGFLGGRVHHARELRRIIRHPGDEGWYLISTVATCHGDDGLGHINVLILLRVPSGVSYLTS